MTSRAIPGGGWTLINCYSAAESGKAGLEVLVTELPDDLYRVGKLVIDGDGGQVDGVEGGCNGPCGEDRFLTDLEGFRKGVVADHISGQPVVMGESSRPPAPINSDRQGSFSTASSN